MKREAEVLRGHLPGRLSVALVVLLAALAAFTAFAFIAPPTASAAEAADVALTSHDAMLIDSNKPTTEGPQCSWMSFDIINASTAGETLTDVVVTFTITGGAQQTLFAQPVDDMRVFSSLADGASVPVYFYIDYFDALSYGPGAVATYEVTVDANELTTPYTYAGTMTTTSSLSANAGGSNVSSTVGPGIWVGQILTTTMTYTFGNNTDICFQPSGATDFNETAYRLVGNRVTNIVSSKVYTGIAIGDTDRLRWDTADIPDAGTEFTIEYYWEVLEVDAACWVNPWAQGWSGQNYKYTGTDNVTYVGTSEDAPITVSKSVDPTFLPTNTSNVGYGAGIVKYTVVFTSSAIDADLYLQKITDALPTGVSIEELWGTHTSGSEITEPKCVTYPAIGATGTVEWTGVRGHWEDTEFMVPAAQDLDDDDVVDIYGTLTLEYLADANGLGPAEYTNSVLGYLNDTDESNTVGPATATFEIGDPTLAVVGSFDAYKSGGKVVVNWETVSEANTVGFYLERQDKKSDEWTRVNEDILPAVFGSSLGGSYSLVDADAIPGAKLTYRLVELEASGETRVYGPYEVKAQAALPSGKGSAEIARGEKGVRIAKTTSKSTAKQDAGAADGAVGVEGSNPDRLRIEVVDTGLYVVTAAEVATGLDLKESKAVKLISSGDLELTSEGEAVAYLPAEDGSALYFYGEAIDSIYTDANVYWLTRGEGEIIEAQSASATGDATASAATTFIDTLHVEQDLEGAPMMFHDPEGDFWLWNYMFAGWGLETQTIEIDVPDVVAGSKMAVRLQGMNTTGVTGEHVVRVTLNDVVLGQTVWTGIATRNDRFTLPVGALESGQNTLKFTALKGSSTAVSWVGLDSVDITYERATSAVEDTLLLTSSESGLVKVGGLSTSDAWVLDVSTATTPEMLPVVDSSERRGNAWVGFLADEDGTYLVCTEAAALHPDAMTGTSGTALSRNGHAEYIIITTADLASAAQPLADYRTGQKLKTTVVTVGEIYDEFNHGIVDPDAIQDFLKSAYSSWNPGPKYVVLVGEGSFDYKDYKGNGDCLVPTLLVNTEYGLATSDVLLADVAGSDGVPELAIGRLPVIDEDELADAIAKIKGYEAATGSWRNSVVLAADDADGGGDFPADSDAMADLLASSLTEKKAYLDDVSLSAARATIQDGFTSGSLWVNYIGHGGIAQLADEGMLTWQDAQQLTGSGFRLPVVSNFSCMTGAYWLPGADGLSEILVKLPTAGAIAVWAPSAMNYNVDSVALGSIFARNMFGSSNTVVIGDQILAAQREAAGAGVPTLAIDTYNLLGDPALRVSR